MGDRIPVSQSRAVISGMVIDESGEPIVDVLVRALADVRIGGTTHLASGPEARTDDRGMYRMADVPPGRYRLSVPSMQASVPGNRQGMMQSLGRVRLQCFRDSPVQRALQSLRVDDARDGRLVRPRQILIEAFAECLSRS